MPFRCQPSQFICCCAVPSFGQKHRAQLYATVYSILCHNTPVFFALYAFAKHSRARREAQTRNLPVFRPAVVGIMNSDSQPIRDIANPGIKADLQLARTLREEVARLLNRNSVGFPGAQPVSFARNHLEDLRREE